LRQPGAIPVVTTLRRGQGAGFTAHHQFKKLSLIKHLTSLLRASAGSSNLKKSFEPTMPVVVFSLRSTVSSAGNKVASGGLRMSKRSLRAAQMLNEARDWARELTLLEMLHPSEPLEEVWRRLERKTGVPFGTFWSLAWRFNSLKDIWASIHALLEDAIESERARKARKLMHDEEVERITSG
jgi:hypothetical protein